MRVADEDRLATARDLYAATYTRLVRVLTFAAGSQAEAEEVVQEAFARLIPRWSTISTYDDPEAWVRKVAFRLAFRRRYRASRRVARPLGAHEGASEPPLSDRVDIVRALNSLPETQRQAVALHYLADLPVAAVAIELGVPIGTVKSRLARARESLRPLLSEGTES